MHRQVGNIWTAYDSANLFLFPGNASLNSSGHLIMGRGMAREVKDRFPGIDKALGAAVKAKAERTPQGYYYGLIVSPRYPEAKVGVLQSKWRWDRRSELRLITWSLSYLAVWLAYHPDAIVHMAMPGIGNGGLNPGTVERTVMGILKDFPNVTVWTKEETHAGEGQALRS